MDRKELERLRLGALELWSFDTPSTRPCFTPRVRSYGREWPDQVALTLAGNALSRSAVFFSPSLRRSSRAQLPRALVQYSR